jgi:hypothetical protein
MQEAVNCFFYPLADLSLCWRWSVAKIHSHHQLRHYEIEELACSNIRIHLAQPSFFDLLFKIVRESGMDSCWTLCVKSFRSLGEASLFHHQDAMKGHGFRSQEQGQKEFAEGSERLFGRVMGKKNGAQPLLNEFGAANQHRLKKLFLRRKMAIKGLCGCMSLFRYLGHARSVEPFLHEELGCRIKKPVQEQLCAGFCVRASRCLYYGYLFRHSVQNYPSLNLSSI